MTPFPAPEPAPIVLDRCPCGRPWTHDPDTADGQLYVPAAERGVAARGPVARITLELVGGDRLTYLIPRHYIARHRFYGWQVPRLGFPQLGTDGWLVFPDLPAITHARCGRTSPNANDVGQRHCPACHVFQSP